MKLIVLPKQKKEIGPQIKYPLRFKHKDGIWLIVLSAKFDLQDH